MINTKKAFTLVELIVVITILAILGTIAFLSLQGYSGEARDAKRLTNVSDISKKISIEVAKGAAYSDFLSGTGALDNNANSDDTNTGYVSYLLTQETTNNDIIKQGTINFTNLGENSEDFRDNATDDDYVYAYAIGGNGDNAYNFMQLATFNESNNDAVVVGNFYRDNTNDSADADDTNDDALSLIFNADGKAIVNDGPDLPYVITD